MCWFTVIKNYNVDHSFFSQITIVNDTNVITTTSSFDSTLIDRILWLIDMHLTVSDVIKYLCVLFDNINWCPPAAAGWAWTGAIGCPPPTISDLGYDIMFQLELCTRKYNKCRFLLLPVKHVYVNEAMTTILKHDILLNEHELI